MDTRNVRFEDSNISAANQLSEPELQKLLRFNVPKRDMLVSLMPQTAVHVLSDTAMDKKGLPLTLSTDTVTLEQKIKVTGDTVFHPDRPVPTLDRDLLLARNAIEVKAHQLAWVGAAVSEINQVGLGYFVRYEFADIYFSEGTGAHEVHGDIRAKYNALGAANGMLGLPATDETSTPDGIGRFNHFQGGSIYWTPNTGAMMVRGAIRNLWAQQGWENSSFGYPIADEHRKVVFNPINKPSEFWSEFQNGAIYSKNNVAMPAVEAEIAPSDLTGLVRKTFDRALKEEDGDLGIEGGVNILNISDWSSGGLFFSRQRMITYEIHGFYSNGIPFVPDPTFRLELQFLFGLTWENSFSEPIAKTLTIYLNHWRISTSGVGHGELHDRLVKGVPNKFPFPVQTIPPEALLIDVLTTAQGGLKFLLEPDVDFPGIGQIRRTLFQTELNNFIES